MAENRMVRLRVLGTAVALAVAMALLCLLLPTQYIANIDLVGLGGHVGRGEAVAAGSSPATVDNTTTHEAIMLPSQRKLFQAAGRFWIFYSDGDDLVYKSSADGLSWSSRSASLGASSGGDEMSVCFDGTYVHYSRSTATNGEPLYYRRGVPGADGTIAWSAAEQVAVAGVPGVRFLYPSVSVNSSGQALISYHFERQNGQSGEGPYVTMSSNSDGTWGATPSGFPYELAADSESEWYTSVLGLTSNKIAVTFADHTEINGVHVMTYDGSKWNAVCTTASSARFGSDYSSVAQGDDLHIVLLNQGAPEIRYCKYTYSTNTIGPESTLLTAAATPSSPALARTSTGDLCCFWAGSPIASHIYYKRMTSGVWDADCTDWIAETDLMQNGEITASYDRGGSDRVGVAWLRTSGSPHEIRFSALGAVPAPNQPPNQPGNVSPANGALGQSLTPVLRSAVFSDPDGDSHAASQWQVAASLDAQASPVFDSQRNTDNLTSIQVPAGILAHSTTYYWHVRYQDNHGDWSDWSTRTSFTTSPEFNRPANRPSNISPGDGASGQSLTPVLQSSEYSDPDGDPHATSEWQIRGSSGDYSSPVFDSEADNSSLVSLNVPSAALDHSTTYYWRVRYQDSHGAWSDWSAETAFTTCAEKPSPTPSGTGPSGLPPWAGIAVAVAAGGVALSLGATAYLAHASLTRAGELASAARPARAAHLTSTQAIAKRLKSRPKHRGGRHQLSKTSLIRRPRGPRLTR